MANSSNVPLWRRVADEVRHLVESSPRGQTGVEERTNGEVDQGNLSTLTLHGAGLKRMASALEKLALIEAACDVSRGWVLRAAGYLEMPTVRDAILADRALSRREANRLLKEYTESLAFSEERRADPAGGSEVIHRGK